MPRVITGKYRGTILQAPKGDNTRPTTDKVKEALFSIIQTRVPDADVLDIFSGTGQIGIEFISRGANSATMVEKAGSAIGIIKSNLAKIHAEDDEAFRIMKAGYIQALNTLADEGKKFDVIFMDPPYKMAHEAAVESSKIIAQRGLLKEDGIMIVEHSSDLPFVTDVINLKFTRSCSYGLSMLTFFQ